MAQSVELTEFWKVKPNNLNNFYVCNVCRLCANVSDNVVPIFDKINGKGSIHDKLKRCLPFIAVRESDIKPKQVCVSCVSKLDLCVSFIEMSLDADSKFDSMLPARIAPPMQIANDRLAQPIINNSDLSWLQIKSEPNWNNIKTEDLSNVRVEPKLPHQSMPSIGVQQLNQQKSYQSTQSAPLAQFKLENDSHNVFVNKQDTNHNILQNFVVPEGVPAQDLIVLVEVKNKENTSTTNNNNNINNSNSNSNSNHQHLHDHSLLINKKNDLNSVNLPDRGDKIIANNDIESLSTKLIDTAVGNFDIGGFTDFVEAQNLLKAFENDLLSALKTENSNDDVPVFDFTPVKTPEKIDKDSLSKDVTDVFCGTGTVTSADSRKKSPPARDFSCSICGRSFTRRNRLNAHLARHSSERPHSCDKCDQRFITRWDLTLHLRIHSGVFSCEYCGKAFPAKGKLERHRRTHTGERPFPCTQCSKAFSEKRNLENHLKTHSVTAKARKNVVSVPSIYMSCGHINPLTAIGAHKSCDICQKIAGDSKIGAVTVVPSTTTVATLLKSEVARSDTINPAVNRAEGDVAITANVRR